MLIDTHLPFLDRHAYIQILTHSLFLSPPFTHKHTQRYTSIPTQQITTHQHGEEYVYSEVLECVLTGDVRFTWFRYNRCITSSRHNPDIHAGIFLYAQIVCCMHVIHEYHSQIIENYTLPTYSSVTTASIRLTHSTSKFIQSVHPSARLNIRNSHDTKMVDLFLYFLTHTKYALCSHAETHSHIYACIDVQHTKYWRRRITQCSETDTDTHTFYILALVGKQFAVGSVFARSWNESCVNPSLGFTCY